MINVRRNLRGGAGRVDINMGPLIDMVFLLLIFFVVTTSFVKETGIDVRSVRAHVERALAEDPESAVVVVADRGSLTGIVVQAMDQCRLAGAHQVSLAAAREGGP